MPRKTNLKLLPVRSSRRSELAAIIYDQNVLGFNGPRLMKGVQKGKILIFFIRIQSCEVLLPRPEESNEQVTELQVTGDNDGLVERFHNGNNTVYTSSINIILLDYISLIEEFVK